MWAWFKKWWPVLVICGLAIAILDGTLSSLRTCHPVSGQGNQAIQGQKAEECTALAGPILISLQWLVHFLDEHGDILVAIFTGFLALYTGRLWFSTEKLWEATTDAIDTAEQ